MRPSGNSMVALWPLMAMALTVACSGSAAVPTLGTMGSSTNSTPVASSPNSTPGSPNNSINAPSPAVAPSESNQSVSPNQANAITVLPNVPSSYTLVGRFDTSVYGWPFFSLEQSKIGARFSGTQLAISLADNGTDVYQFELDGNVLPTTLRTDQIADLTQANTFIIAQNLNDMVHTVWISKMTEYLVFSQVAPTTQHVGQAVFYGLVLSENANVYTPPTPKPHLIEALGDSAFTGYGVLSSTATCGYSPETQDATQSISANAGNLLNAEVINVSASGVGMYSSVYNSDPNDMLPVLYPLTAPNPFDVTQPVWTFKSEIPDVVVIDGGGDDLVGADGNGSLPNPNAFVSTYTNLLALMRSNYPNALIIACISPQAEDNDITTLTHYIGEAIANRAQSGDTNVLLFNFFTGTPYTTYSEAAAALDLDYGCNSHPGIKGSQYLGRQLANFILQYRVLQ